MGLVGRIKAALIRPKLDNPGIVEIEEYCADGWCGHVEYTHVLVESVDNPHAVNYAISRHLYSTNCKNCGTILKDVKRRNGERVE